EGRRDRPRRAQAEGRRRSARLRVVGSVMSRIGRKPVSIPQGVKVQIEGATVRAEGPKGKLMQPVPAGLSAKLDGNQLVISRTGDDRKIRAMHGLARALMADMVTGVKGGFERRVDLVGIGERAGGRGKG